MTYRNYAEVVAEILKERGYDTIHRGCYSALDDAYFKAGNRPMKRPHPLNRHAAVMASVGRSSLFVRDGSITIPVSSGAYVRPAPFYRLVAS